MQSYVYREEINNCVDVKRMWFIKTERAGNMSFGDKQSLNRWLGPDNMVPTQEIEEKEVDEPVIVEHYIPSE